MGPDQLAAYDMASNQDKLYRVMPAPEDPSAIQLGYDLHMGPDALASYDMASTQ